MASNPYQKIERYKGYWNQEVVLYQGEEVIDQGTVREIAERRGCRKDSIYWLTTPAGHRRAETRRDQSKALRGVRV